MFKSLSTSASKHLKTTVVATALLAVGFTPTAVASKVHTQTVAMTCMVHSTGGWCAPTASSPAPAAAAATVSHS